MDATDAYGSQWMKSEDVPDKGFNAKVEKVKPVQIDGEPAKLELHFENMDKVILLNITNGKKMIDLFGKETDFWVGKVVHVYKEETKYKGNKVMGIRLRAPVPLEEG